jgi:hypothetical protein
MIVDAREKALAPLAAIPGGREFGPFGGDPIGGQPKDAASIA